MGFGIFLPVPFIWLYCQRFVLGWLYRLWLLLSWLRRGRLLWRRYAFDKIFSPNANGRKKLSWADCNSQPISQLALMIVNIFAVIISAIVTILVSSPLCCANKSTTENHHRVTSNARVATIDTTTDSDISTGARTVVMRGKQSYLY